jgi:hypothetical protein
MSNYYTATFSCEDAKLRLYATSRLDAETYSQAKALGFQWAPKQTLFVAPSWSPAREDFLLELAGEIDDEDYSPEERAADRAERFGDYRDKRSAEAGAGADRFEAGPSAFGHQNRARAERQANRHDRFRTYAVSQWSKAEYWQSRTAAVIHHALFKSSAPGPPWSNPPPGGRATQAREGPRGIRRPVRGMAGRSGTRGRRQAGPVHQHGHGYDAGSIPRQITPALKAAYALANSRGNCWGDYVHPRTGQKTSASIQPSDRRD